MILFVATYAHLISPLKSRTDTGEANLMILKATHIWLSLFTNQFIKF